MARYRIARQSKVMFEAKSSLHPIHGEITGMEGELELELDDGHLEAGKPVMARGQVSVDRLVSGNALYDKETMRRIEARKYPYISGELRTIEPDGGANRYRTVTDITFHGVTRPVEGEISLTVWDDGRRVVLEGEHTFDMRDFGVDPPKMLMLKVHPDIKIRAQMVAERSDQ